MYRLIVLLNALLFTSLVVPAVLAAGSNSFAESARLISSGQFNKANYYYYKVLDENAKSKEALYGLSNSLYQSGHHAEAIKWLDKLISIDVSHSAGLLLRSRVNIIMKQHSRALTDLEILVTTNTNAEVYLLLESVYTAMGDRDSAEQARDTFMKRKRQGAPNKDIYDE